MKHIFKIALVLFILLSLVFSSCKKEEIVSQPGCTDSTMSNYNPYANIDDGSCIPFTYGCIDAAAFNYDSAADTDDYSCIYAYDLALGVWNINADCEEIDILGQIILLNDQLPESIDIQGEGGEEGMLYVYIGEAQVSASIDISGNIIVVEQTASIDVGLGVPVPVNIAGSGKVESESDGYMNLTFSGEIDLIPGFPASFSSACYITLSK